MVLGCGVVGKLCKDAMRDFLLETMVIIISMQHIIKPMNEFTSITMKVFITLPLYKINRSYLISQ